MMKLITGWMGDDHRDRDEPFAQAENVAGNHDRAASRSGRTTW
ncbi:hypothetical protein ACKVEX_09710 [Rhodocyclaceae bacterium SMB388]